MTIRPFTYTEAHTVTLTRGGEIRVETLRRSVVRTIFDWYFTNYSISQILEEYGQVVE